MIYKEKEKSRFARMLEKYPPEQRLTIIRRRKIIIIVICCLTICLTFCLTPLGMMSKYFIASRHKEVTESIKYNFISRAELEESEIYLNQCCDYFTAKAKELKGTDTDICEIHFSIGQINSPVKIWIYGDNERLLNELYIDIPQDIHSALYEVHFGSPAIYVFENEIQFNYWDMERGGGYLLCRSLNNYPPTESCKNGLYFYVKDGWWNVTSWHILRKILFY